jgi:hypothetical protein
LRENKSSRANSVEDAAVEPLHKALLKAKQRFSKSYQLLIQGYQMAYKMKLATPYNGMPFIWNISQKVGVSDSCENLRDDVELFQRIVLIRNKYPRKTLRPATINDLTIATGEMDTQTGYEIFWANAPAMTIQDAQILSPAKNGQVSYGGGGIWKIVYFNYKLFTLNKNEWEKLPDTCSAPLKLALTTKTSP